MSGRRSPRVPDPDPAAVRARASDLLWNVALALIVLTLLCTVLVPPSG
ncbi:MAG: hypothetical protein R6X25_08620 [Candidatus Krumholzibacteriia bacterium]